MAKAYVRENVPLSRFGVLVAQLESIVASSVQQQPEPLMCFDLLSDLISSIEEEPKDSILLWQRKCEDALYSLLTLGARRPVRHLASVAMARIISRGDAISIYSRASSLQGFLSNGKRSEPHKVAGAAQCLGELYRFFGRKITSGLLETTIIATKLMKFNEEFVRHEAILMLQNALEGSGGGAATSAYTEAYRLITRFAIGDNSFIVRIAAARCLKAFANIGGPGLGVGEIDNSASCCVKALDDPVSSVRDAFAEALGSLLALGMNPGAQVQPKGKGPFPPAKKLEGGLQKHLSLPFSRGSGARSKEMRIGLALSWVFFLQAIRIKYSHPDGALQDFVLQVMDMLRADVSVDAHSLACVLYILRVGVTDQMTEPTQRSFLVFLAKQLQSPGVTASMKIAALRTLSYTLNTLGEVPTEFKEVLDDTVVPAVSDSSQLVRTEVALMLRALAEADPTSVGGLVSYGVTTLGALRENVSFEKGSNLRVELDTLHGQASVLGALVYISPKLPLGYPARLPMSVLEVSKKMLTESNRNPMVATVEEESGWLLLSSLLASVPKEELEDQVFDILSLWADLFSGDPEHEINQSGDLTIRISVWSAAIDALTGFIRCFVTPKAPPNNGIFLQPTIVYLSRALSYISLVASKELLSARPAMNLFIIRTLIAYQSLPDPITYKNDHYKIMQLCTTPFRDPSGCEESSCLRFLLDKRDAWLGPWIPGRDWFEDELRAFQGGKDGLVPCVWEDELSSFPQPETINKTLVNQMLLCFGVMFASQDSNGMLSLLGMIEQCLKAGKKQSWHAASVTNICVGLLAGLKALISSRSQPLGLEILTAVQAIFQSILAEGDICASHRRASSEALGLLARLGNDIFTARMIRSLLSDLMGITDSSYAGSIALTLGCIHRCAGGMALSSLVTATVSSLSSLAKSPIAGLQIWSLHGLLLTIEAAGLTFVSQVQGTLGLAMDILMSEENGWVDLQQGVGRVINAIVAVLGPELSPGSNFFLRCKSVVSEISSSHETATLLESVRFTQQLVLFAPQAVSVHSHVQTLLSTLSSRQPALRHLAVSTLRHLIEKDPVSIIDEKIEDNLFHMLDEETDSEIGNLVRSTIMRLLYASCPSCPSHWISICHNMVLATPARRNADTYNNMENDGQDGDAKLNISEDDENMVSSSRGVFDVYNNKPNRDKHLRYLTRIFAVECLSHLPTAVGKDPAHFNLSIARKQPSNGQSHGDWLVLHLQELIGLAYQISTIQFESIQPLGVGLLSTIMDKFEMIPDPELPGHLLLEQYQAQLVSAVRTSLDASSGPILLEAGLQLATKILTSGIISGDQGAVRRIFSLISRPLEEFKDLYYPSFAEWVSCKIKVRLLAAHASLKCFTYAFLRRHHSGVPDEYLALLPLFAKSSSTLGKYWIQILKDYTHICLRLHLKRNWNSFLDGIQSSLVKSKLKVCLEEAWPVILQALALDAVPVNSEGNGYSKTNVENVSRYSSMSGYSMVELGSEEYKFLWGFALLVLFQGLHSTSGQQIIGVASALTNYSGDASSEETNPMAMKLYEIVLPVFQSLSTEKFFGAGYLTLDICQELLQVFSYSIYMDISWNSLAISVLSQILQNCPEEFLEKENFSFLSIELCLAYLFKLFRNTTAISPDRLNWEDLISPLFVTAKTLVTHFNPKKQVYTVILAFLLVGYKGIGESSTELCVSKVTDFLKHASRCVQKIINDKSNLDQDVVFHLRSIIMTCIKVIGDLTENCIKSIHQLDNKRFDLRKLLQTKLAVFLEQIVSISKSAHDIDSLVESRDSTPIYFSLLRYSTKCIQTVLSDPNIHVRATGLQVLKSMIQRGSNSEDMTFLMFLSGEFIIDVFKIIENYLKGPITKDSVVIISDCLRILLLLQTLSKNSECQRSLMNLLLEAIVMVFSASDHESSPAVTDVRNNTIRLVSQLAQIPSSASHFKDALLTLSPVHMQRVQGVIRASVMQNQPETHMKDITRPLEIKLPTPLERSRTKDSPPPAATTNSTMKNVEEDEDDDDDWDAFQSFPASTNASASDSKQENFAENPTLVEENTLDSEREEINHPKDSPCKEETISECPQCENGEESDSFETNYHGNESYDEQHQEQEDEEVEREENKPISSDPECTLDAEVKDSIDEVPSDPVSPESCGDDETQWKADGKTDTEEHQKIDEAAGAQKEESD